MPAKHFHKPTASLRLALVAALLLLSGCVTWSKGVSPREPSRYILHSRSSVKSLTPMFSWEPYTEKIKGMQNVRYELQVSWKSTLVYSVETEKREHTIAKALLPGQVYQWYVRPVFDLGENVMRGDWSRQGYFFLTPWLLGWGERSYEISTPAQ